jgi:hypothetical protein
VRFASAEMRRSVSSENRKLNGFDFLAMPGIVVDVLRRSVRLAGTR